MKFKLPPPLVFLTLLLVGYGCHVFLDTIWLGLGLMALGGIIFIWGALFLKKHETTILPWGEPTSLVTNGPYRFSRNPIYLGFFMIGLGGAVVFQSLWILAMDFLALYIITHMTIMPEERKLVGIFNDTYKDYCQQTPRWIYSELNLF